ncbi:MAG TPA: FHA domain-containing protein [Gemmataceae bacterium]|nr:FHA domain-containing protein [Gemmataceae bacterium]
MDDQQPPSGASSLPLQGPHWHPERSVAAAVNFAPLRLLLQPGGTVVEVTKPDTLVGRHSEADIGLRLPDVSRRHCRFVFTNHHWHVFDLQSLNGLFVNGERVRQAMLRHRDTVRIGSLTFEVDLLHGPPTVQLPVRNPKSSEHGILGSISNALPRVRPSAGPDRLAS